MPIKKLSHDAPYIISTLSPNDRKELRNFVRFLALWSKHKDEMMKRKRWQKYLGVFK